MQLKRTLSLTLIMALLIQLWVAGASFAAAGGPVMISTSPANNEVTVPANAMLKIKFDENVVKASGGVVSIKNSNTNVAVASYDLGNPTQSAYVTIDPTSASTIQINPNGKLVAGQNYYVEISPNAFLNVAGAGFAGINDATTWNFRVIASDVTPPSATTTPVSGGTMPATGAIKLAFNEKVWAASGNIRITRLDTSDTQVISVLSPEVTGSGIVDGTGKTTIVIQPSIRLVSGKNYQVMVEQGAFVDVVGNAYYGTTWNFSTTASPITLISKVPADNSANVSLGALTAKMTFASAVLTGTSGNIYLKKVLTNETVETISMATGASRVTGSGTTAINIAFYQPLVANTEYYIMMDPGVLKDASGNLYEGIVDAVTWNFTTASGVDNTPPLVSAFTPAAGGAVTAVNGMLSIKFNELVKPGSGMIVIRNASSQAVVCSIPVTHSAVTGGGTDTIKITPSVYSACGSFVKNTSYAVQIGSLAITDLAGNPYAGIPSTNYSTWWFKVNSDTVRPELISTIPVSGTNSVKEDAVLTMLFDKSVTVHGVAATLNQVVSGTIRDSIPATLSVDSTNSRKVILTPTRNLTRSATYVVSIPDNAITDLALNAYPGILNDYRWTFQTIGSDRTAPTFSSAAMDGSAIVLTYNEELDSTVVPYPANYYVTVNDVPRQVNGITINGKTVRLILQSGVAVGQTVKVSYTKDSDTDHQLQDLSGNKAVALSSKEVTNSSDTTLAKPLSGVLNGSTLTLNFNKSLAAPASGASYQFSVKYNGYSQSISAISVNGSVVTLTLPSSVTETQSVSVSYAPGSTPLRDLSGNAVPAFTDFYVQNVNDTVAPTLTSATASGTKVILSYNEGLSAASVPLKSNFSVIKNGTTAAISSVAIVNNTVELTMTQAVATNAVLYVSYIQTSQGIKDLAGNLAATFNSYPVTGVAATTTQLVASSVYNNEITLTYSAALNNSSVPYASQYYVKVNGTFANVSSVNIVGTQVRVLLTSPVATGSTVVLSYMATGNSVKDLQNQAVSGINEMTITNQSTLPGGGGGGGTIVGLPDYVEADGSGGVQLIVAKSSSIYSGTAPSGKSMNRYTLDGTKLLAAYDAIRQNSGIAIPRLTFKVPSTEVGALVTIPINSLMDASSRASNASFRLEYGDMQFEIPLSAINYSKEIYLAGGSTTTSSLQISIDKAQNSPVLSTLNILGAQSMTTPADFSAGILTGTNYKAVENYEQYVTRSFALPGFSGSTDNLAVIRLDSDSNQPSYVPTLFENVNGSTKVNFKRKGNSEYAVVRRNASFTDMAKHWANGDVTVLASKFIVTGDTNKTFAPGKNITRADFAEFLARGIGLNGDKSSASRYTDVSLTNPSASYIGAVSKAGIVEGGTDGKFRPNANVTREEMATMLIRAMNYVGVQSSSSSTALNGFKDKAKVSGWAKEGMSISVTVGFIKGSTTKTINPQSKATRAEAAIMIKRFLEYVDFL
ncbi:Ig-like domain-containing protein [Cohnella cholangitidis]|uniref:Ig-like domain-containing protein n=1 Tax=Cohnella cholangitidis TaxID=2598458 RepID=UPI0015FBA065|nr:Ig-like domain-containing protein [Cohnella cholangitidis]